MTRRLPEPMPELPQLAEGRRKAHAALDSILEPAICKFLTGEINIKLELHEGGVRRVFLGTEEVYKNPS